MIQQDLFAKVAMAYAEAPDGVLDNAALYRAVADPDDIRQRSAVGKSGQKHSLTARAIRWQQQTAKHLGLIERVDRGVWKLTHHIKEELHRATEDIKLVAFSTDLGIAIWSRHESVFNGFNEPISLMVSSPPYPLRYARAYGNPAEAEYVDFICRALEPIVRNLVPGGSIVLNISNDIFLRGSPALSDYPERMVIALRDRLGLYLLGRIPWVNTSKPPSPTHWACSIQGGRKQLCSGWEPIFWFSNTADGKQLRSDNRRVLQEHSERHKRLMAGGGEKRAAEYGDGAYVLKEGSFSNQTKGSIPKNVILRGHRCVDTNAYRKYAKDNGLQVHGAMQPTFIPDFFIQFLTEPGELVVDPFGGTGKTALAAERLGRRWLITDWMYEYLYGGGASLFSKFSGFQINQRIPTMERIAA